MMSDNDRKQYTKTHCWSSISKPIEKKPIIVTLCRGTRPDASKRVSCRVISRRMSWRVVARIRIRHRQQISRRDLLFSDSSYGFGAFGLASQHSTIRTHFLTVSEGNVEESLWNASLCFALITMASWKRLAKRVPLLEWVFITKKENQSHLRKPTILWKFHPFQWSFKVSCRAAGAISRTLGASGFVCDQLISTSSPHVLPAPFV